MGRKTVWRGVEGALIRNSPSSNHHQGRHGPDYGKTNLPGRKAERDDDQRDLEALEQHSFEGEEERHPVHAAGWNVVFLDPLFTHARETARLHATHALAAPLHPTHHAPNADA